MVLHLNMRFALFGLLSVETLLGSKIGAEGFIPAGCLILLLHWLHKHTLLSALHMGRCPHEAAFLYCGCTALWHTPPGHRSDGRFYAYWLGNIREICGEKHHFHGWKCTKMHPMLR